MHIFSYCGTRPSSVSNLSLVNKEWLTCARNDNLWCDFSSSSPVMARSFFSKSLIDTLSVKNLRLYASERSRHDVAHSDAMKKCVEKGEMRVLFLRTYDDLYFKWKMERILRNSPCKGAFASRGWAGFDQLYFGSHVCRAIDRHRRFISEEELCSKTSWDFYFKMQNEGGGPNQGGPNSAYSDDELDVDNDDRFDTSRAVRGRPRKIDRRRLHPYGTSAFSPNGTREYKMSNPEHNDNHPDGLAWRWFGAGVMLYQKGGSGAVAETDATTAATDDDVIKGLVDTWPGGHVYCKEVGDLESLRVSFEGVDIRAQYGITRHTFLGKMVRVGAYPPLLIKREDEGTWSMSNYHVRLFSCK